MGRWKTAAEDWLSNEAFERDGAEKAFGEVFACLPSIQPSTDFVHRTASAAWVARARRRGLVAAGFAASVLMALLTGAALYPVVDMFGAWFLTTAVTFVASAVTSAAVAAMSAMDVWLASAVAGGTVADVIAGPQGLATVSAVALTGIGALYMLQRVLHTDAHSHATSR